MSLIMLDSVIKVNKKYYPQTFLEECKYKIKKNKMESRVNEDFEPSSSDESVSESDSELLTMNDLLMNLGIKSVF